MERFWIAVAIPQSGSDTALIPPDSALSKAPEELKKDRRPKVTPVVRAAEHPNPAAP